MVGLPGGVTGGAVRLVSPDEFSTSRSRHAYQFPARHRCHSRFVHLSDEGSALVVYPYSYSTNFYTTALTHPAPPIAATRIRVYSLFSASCFSLFSSMLSGILSLSSLCLDHFGKPSTTCRSTVSAMPMRKYGEAYIDGASGVEDVTRRIKVPLVLQIWEIDQGRKQ